MYVYKYIQHIGKQIYAYIIYIYIHAYEKELQDLNFLPKGYEVLNPFDVANARFIIAHVEFLPQRSSDIYTSVCSDHFFQSPGSSVTCPWLHSFKGILPWVSTSFYFTRKPNHPQPQPQPHNPLNLFDASKMPVASPRQSRKGRKASC